MSLMLRCAAIGALILVSACKPAADAGKNPGPVKPGGNVSTPVGVSELKPSECEELGGTIKYDSQCDDFKLTCEVKTTTGTNRSCIDELDVGP